MTVHLKLDDDARGHASLYALGSLAPEDALAYEAHLGDCAACRGEVEALRPALAALGSLAPEVTPPPGLKARLLDRIHVARQGQESAGREHSERKTPGRKPAASIQVWKSWSNAPAPSTLVLRAAEGDWEDVGIPGIRVRRLFFDPEQDRVTMLVRMDPGSAYPPHRHGGPEECYVLSGQLHVGADLTMHAGDFQHVDRGAVHAVQSTDEGCLLLIVSSLRDEILRDSIS